MADDRSILDTPDEELPPLYSLDPEDEKKRKEASEEEVPETEEEETPEEEYEEEDEEELTEEDFSEEPQRQRIYVDEDSEEESEDDTESAEETTKESAKSKSDDMDYKTAYLKTYAPFKANGKVMKVDSVEDARQLMQMGANYQYKMQALAPHLRILRALEQNDLLTEEAVNFYIDLRKKNPDAIAKFLKDSEIDPLDLNLDDEKQYVPQDYVPSQKDNEFFMVLDEAKTLPTWPRFLEEVVKKWDEESLSAFKATPVLIRVLNDHIETGVYDTIMETLEREQLMGRLNGVRYLDAYKKIGDDIQARGGFKNVKSTGKPGSKRVARKDSEAIRRRKQAAAPSKGNAKRISSKDFNPLAMSDEEFEKALGKVLI